MSDDTANTAIEVAEVEVLPAETPEAMPAPYQNLDLEKDTETDYDFVRDKLKEIIGSGTTALDDMIILAQQMDHPRAFEVVGQLLKSVTDSTNQLIELQKNMKDLTASEKPKSASGVNVAFFGSTHDLQKLISGKTDISSVEIVKPEDD